MQIQCAQIGDLSEILQLQRLAWREEAEKIQNLNIQPLMQTIEEIHGELVSGIILKAVGESGEIIGSVRGRIESGTLYIGKLMVHPKHQNQGIGRLLLAAIENMFPQCRCELFTNGKNPKNLYFYESAGYIQLKEEAVSDLLSFIYFEKPPRL